MREMPARNDVSRKSDSYIGLARAKAKRKWVLQIFCTSRTFRTVGTGPRGRLNAPGPILRHIVIARQCEANKAKPQGRTPGLDCFALPSDDAVASVRTPQVRIFNLKRGLNILGGFLLAVGLVWALQGMNVLLGSFMSGQPKWLYIGIITAIAGLALLVWNNFRAR